MLVTFKSKAAGDVVMYGEHAKRLLDLLGKDVSRGVITADEASDAVAKLEEEIACARAQAEAEQARLDADAAATGDAEAPHPMAAPVPFSTRIYPLLEMLRAAQKDGHFVTWGV